MPPAPAEPPPVKAPLASAVANAISVLVLVSLSLATFGYIRALEPLYGSAPTEYNLNKVVWSACILGGLVPTLPLRYVILTIGVLLSAMPVSSYWVAVYTGRIHNIILGPVITHLAVLGPVLFLGVALVKALHESPDANGVAGSASTQAITIPVCRMAIYSLLEVWRAIPLFSNIEEHIIFSLLGGTAITLWLVSPFLTASVPASGAATAIEGIKAKGSPVTRVKNSSMQSSPQKKMPAKRSGNNSWRILALPVVPFLISSMKPPTLPKPLLEPYVLPNASLRILSSVRSSFSSVVVVGEVLPPSREDVESGNVHEPHSLRYLRAGHSLLGGVWIGDRVFRRDASGPLMVDSNGTALGDSIYGTFVMQEAVRLVERPPKAEEDNALIIGLGTGIAARALMQHSVSTTIVEIDPAVYDAARRYFMLPEPEKGRLFLEDARAWVRRHRMELEQMPPSSVDPHPSDPALFDYVVHDCFSGGTVPGHIFTVEFWEDLKAITTPSGVVAINFAGKLGSDSSIAIVITLQQVFTQCRVFHDSLEPLSEEQLQSDFVNWVFFCTPSSNPLEFRSPTDADFLASFLRERMLSTLLDREIPIARVANNLSESDIPKYVLKDDANPLVDWQQREALHHWGVMREVLPDIHWETY
ncbi:hypothetical protein K474DRAFT_1611352 [Panus rudis PR-1116 ss-1]|nr:hypothetical protein K474DRAFT_1611352 [Panus rudis PR-1116 ss-1]